MLINKINLDALVQEPFVCPQGYEYVVGSTKSNDANPVYAITGRDDLNIFTIPSSLLGNRKWGYTCLTHMKSFVTYGFNEDGTVNASVILGNRGSEQMRRYPIAVEGLHATDAHAFEGFNNSVLHWFTTDDGPVFYETYDRPIVQLESPKVLAPTDYIVTFTVTNKGDDKVTFKRKVTVHP